MSIYYLHVFQGSGEGQVAGAFEWNKEIDGSKKTFEISCLAEERVASATWRQLFDVDFRHQEGHAMVQAVSLPPLHEEARIWD